MKRTLDEKNGPKAVVTRCAVYTRVSTDGQAEVEFNSCEAQEMRVRSFISSQDGFEVFKVYSDPGFTGANMDRPALQRLLADVRARKVDMVVTYKIDRLTRSPRDFYQMIEVFEKSDVGYISVTERFDTSTPAGRLLRNIMLTFAQFERELTSERIRDKFLERAKRGLFNGGRPPYGYRVVQKKLVPDARKAKIVRFIYETYISTKSLNETLKALEGKWIRAANGGPMRDSSVWHILRNPVLTGKVIHNDKTYPGAHPAIISEELFSLAQEIHKDLPRNPQPYAHLPYGGLLHCKECGSAMTTAYIDKENKDGPRRYHYYRCSSLSHRGWKACTTRQINAERLHDVMTHNLVRISMDTDYLRNLVHCLKTVPRSPGRAGYQPENPPAELTPQNLQEALKAYVKDCARKTGLEKTLAIRGGIEKVVYSKESVSVGFRFRHSSDGKTASSPETTPGSDEQGEFRPEPHPGMQEGTGRPSDQPPQEQYVSFKMAEESVSVYTTWLTFPNIAHNYWDNYRLFKQYNIRKTETSTLI